MDSILLEDIYYLVGEGAGDLVAFGLAVVLAFGDLVAFGLADIVAFGEAIGLAMVSAEATKLKEETERAANIATEIALNIGWYPHKFELFCSMTP